MLAGFLLGIVHDRRLMREAQVNLAIRWFAGFGLNDRLPDHSSLTGIRQRWGPDRFRRIFERTVRRNRRLEPSYKQHGAVDDECGVILDVEVTTGEINEGQEILSRLDAVAAVTEAPIGTVTADAGYAYAKVFAGLEGREIIGVIPTKAEPIRSKVPLRRFRYDAHNDIVKCPRGKILRPNKAKIVHGRFFASKARDCKGCDLAHLCLSHSRVTKSVVIVHDYPALLRAHRRRLRWGAEDVRLYRRHRWRSEGFHGEVKTWHGLARAVRRGLDNMRIQAFLTAAAINLKRLAAALLAMICALIAQNAARARPIRA